MDSQDLARFIEQTDSIGKPWLLVQLRLAKLQENRPHLTESEYLEQLQDIQQDLMNLGEWWQGQEDQVFQPQRFTT